MWFIYFMDHWKNGNIVPIRKKGDKQILKNYRPVSLLPICGEIFERLIFNDLFNFFLENNLILPNQSGFKPGDSCINQLLSMTHKIYNSFDEGLEVRSVFLDISKAFDKVCAFILKALLVPKIFKFVCWIFWPFENPVKKRLKG